MKQLLLFFVPGIFLFSGISNISAQHWTTSGGTSERNGISTSYGPETLGSPVWTILDASASVWGNAIYAAGGRFATSRVKFSPTYHVIVECRNLANGAILWEKNFPNDGKLYVVGMTEDAVYVHNYATDSLFAFEPATGAVKWVCPEKTRVFGGAHGILFTCEGDPVVNGPGLYAESLIRLNRHTGEVMWYNTNWVSVSPAPDFCIYGDRLYKWEGAIGIPTHLVAIDLATGENLFFSDPVDGDADQEIPLTAGSDGTIYGQRDGGELWAFTDEGDAFDVKWSYVPQSTGMGTYGNVGIGPDGSVYFPDGTVVVQLDPETGALLNTSEPLAASAMSGTFITTDQNGTVFISNTEAGEGKYLAFSADLQTTLWEKPVTYNYYSGIPILENGLMIFSGGGSNIEAYASQLPHPTVPWFEGKPRSTNTAGSVLFTDHSSFSPDTWHWIFPGGNPAESFAETPPPVNYPDPGSYDVTLITSNSMGIDTTTRFCYIGVETATSINWQTDGETLSVFPNPCRERLTIVLPDHITPPATATLSDLSGRILKHWTLLSSYLEISPEQLPGIYILQITSKTDTYTNQILIQ